jgi:hypothetical protein
MLALKWALKEPNKGENGLNSAATAVVVPRGDASMSITAISSSVVSAVREFAQAAAQPAPATRRSAGEPRDGGRRHDLVGAMNQVLGVTERQDAADQQAVFRVAHALMHDLRSIEVAPARDGQPAKLANEQMPGRAWGRREWNDLPQRLDALATAVSASASAAMAVSSEVEMPPQPNPITTNSAALHLMQVPSSRLLEAYVALRKAVGEQASASADGVPRDELAAFIERLSKELVAGAPASLPTGSVVNLTA